VTESERQQMLKVAAHASQRARDLGEALGHVAGVLVSLTEAIEELEENVGTRRVDDRTRAPVSLWQELERLKDRVLNLEGRTEWEKPQ
jgi:hypothetical protein